MTDTNRECNRTCRRLLLSVALACLPPAAASAAIFAVNSTADEPDFTIDGVCETAAGNGVCTLRAAFSESQAESFDDTILLPEGDFVLDSSLGGILASDGALTIRGVGLRHSVIRAGAVSPSLASFIQHLNSLTLQRLTVKDFPGTAIRSSGPLFVFDSSFEFNGSSGYEGGSIHSAALLSIFNTAFVGGFAAKGGAIYHDRLEFWCTRCTFEGAVAESYGGAIYLGDLATTSVIDASLFAGNSTPGLGGAIHYYFTSASGSSLRIVNSTFHGNQAGSLGGAICALTTGMVILNSTITDNTADSNLDGYGTGGGVFSNPSDNLIYNSILSGNMASITIEPGGNVWAWPQDCAGSFLSNGYNIVRNVFTGCAPGDLSCCTFTGGAPSTADPLLDSLTYNGGLTRTRALVPGSPAIGGARPDGCADGQGGFLSTDQRGASRPQFGCDLGAFEYGSLVFADGFELWNWKWSLVAP